MDKIPKDMIDADTFEQILEMDDDDERDFSKAIVFEFFTQAESTFEQIDEKLRDRDLESLSALGHFLKGSSATLGLIKIKDACEAIQNLGKGLNENATTQLNNADESLARIRAKFTSMKNDYEKVKKSLNVFYCVD